MEQMNRKKIGIGVGVAVVLGVSAAFYFCENYPARPEREPDMIGEFQRVEGNMLILKPLEKEDFPFKDLSREEIREKMRASSHEEREAFRDKMKELLRDEKGLELAEEVEVVMNRKRIELEDLGPEIGIRVWFKLDGSEVVEFVSARTAPSKKVDHK